MGFEIVKKYTADLEEMEIGTLSDLVNKCFYLGTLPQETVREIFFSDGDLYNFIVADKGEPIGLFQSKDLSAIEASYIFSASVRPYYRGRGIFPQLIDVKIDCYRSRERGYIGARSMNPLVIEKLIRRGFHNPVEEDPELLKKAKEILTAMEGNNLGIRDDFVIPRKGTSKYPNALDIGECDDPEISAFITAHMDIRNGDRLFLIREM
jgi:hypothetical protein